MHGRRTSRLVAASIVTSLALSLTGCADRSTQSVLPAPASSSAAPASGPSSQASSSLEPANEPSTAALPSIAAVNPAKVVKGVAYRPTIDPASFTTTIDNPYLPIVSGTAMTYDGGGEHSVWNVTDRTKTIMGVEVRVVRDQGFDHGALIEDTEDYFAQDAAGNVWYFGEATAECQGHRITSRAGSWIGGVDGAQPGVAMLAQPTIGDFYRQEYLKGEAEDVAKVLQLGVTLTAHLGTYSSVIITEDTSRLEPTVIEHKNYAPGVGLVAEQATDANGVLQLVKVDPRAGAGPSTKGPLCRV